MIDVTAREKLVEILPGERVLFMEPMKKHTTFQVGGAAECFVEIGTEEELKKIYRYVNEKGIPFLIVGNGSNLLVSDDGFQGIVIETRDSFDRIRVEGNRLSAQSGALLSKLANAACENGLSGLEFAAGIPGTAGGAVIMNAGAYGGEMSQVVEKVKVIDPKGESHILGREEMDFQYRSSSIKNRPYAVSEVEFILKPGNREEIKNCMKKLSEARREKQPLEFPSAGSTFKRPEGYFAGKLIMDAGFRGCCVGDAQVSEKHCGFIINRGQATAKDISDLMDRVSEGVYEKFHVHLEPEVIRVGKF